MQTRNSRQLEPALAFTLMKFAFQIFEKKVMELTMEEYAMAYQQACHEMALHEMILLSEAACGVVIPESVSAATIRILQTEYGGEENFFHHLQRNKLQPGDYFDILNKNLKIEAVLTRVAYSAEPVSQREIQDFYHNHLELFYLPEQRSARHIFISTENYYSHLPKNSPQRRILNLHSRLQRHPQIFSQVARIYSDCTTAIDGGDLGRISQGELCPVLDHTLFQLAAGAISPIIRSAHGYHLLLCEAIHPRKRCNLEMATRHIRQILTGEKRVTTCKKWLKSLLLGRKVKNHAETN
jgi:nitrogen fixation protein NifM